MKRLVLFCAALMLMGGGVKAQDAGQKNGFGIKVTGDYTFSHERSKTEDTRDGVLYHYAPVDNYQGLHLDVYYRQFIKSSRAFVDGQLSGYYLGQRKQDVRFYGMDVLDEYNDVVINDDMNEWGGGASLTGGYNFALNSDCSLDAFTGPEVRCAFSSKNDFHSKDLLDWHFNRWLMRWKLGAGFNYRHVGVQLYGSLDVTRKSKQFNTRDFTLSLALGYKF